MRAVGVALLTASALAILASACGSSVTTTTTRNPPGYSLPLNDALATPEGTVAAIPMGHLDDPLNTFWQTFVLVGTKGRWVLTTPTGVADNGGLVLAADRGQTVVGFRPSQLLEFSPLAATGDGGRHYATTAVVPAGLSDAPDALGVGTGGEAVALTGSTVLASSSGLGHWRSVATRSSIAATAAGRACAPLALTAVVVGPDGPVVGGSCAHPGVVGLFDIYADTRLIGPRLGLSVAEDGSEVIRAVTYQGRLALLIEVRGRGSTDVVAAWQGHGGRWTTSVPLASGPIEATAVTSGGGFVILRAGHRSDVIPDAGKWTPLPAVPAGTELVASTGRRLDALSVNASTMTDYELSHGRWTRVSRTQVHIVYGSSS